MKIQCNSSELAKACLNVQRTVSNKSTIPALEGILIDAKENNVTLTGYDLEVGSVATIDAEVSSQGKIVLNAKNLCDILRMLPDDVVTIDCDERNISKIKSGETEYSLIGTPADDYPELPSVNKYTSITLELGTIKDMIKKTIFSVSTSERNPVHCVTHSPQIAAIADEHLFVSKTETEGRTESSVRTLSSEEHIQEVARIIGGAKITEQTLAAAKELCLEMK